MNFRFLSLILGVHLLQLFKKWPDSTYFGQFEAPKVKPNVVEMKSFHRGRESFLVTASRAAHSSMTESNIVEAFKIVEIEMKGVTANAMSSYLKPVKIGSDAFISVNDVKKIETLEFHSTILIAVLDVDVDVDVSRLRIFSFSPSNEEPYVELSSKTFTHGVFKTMHGFKHHGIQHLVLAGSDFQNDKVVITQVQIFLVLFESKQFSGL